MKITKEKYADGSFKYIHDCSRCSTGTYLGSKRKINGFCHECLVKIRKDAGAKGRLARKNKEYANKWQSMLISTEGVTQAALQEIFYYIPEGLLLYKDSFSARSIKDTVAGTVSKYGYRSVSINGNKYQLSYLIWIFHGNSPEEHLHFKDRNNNNCRIENLQSGRACNTPLEFEVKANEVHNHKYRYFNDYIGNHTNVRIMCEDHGVFYQEPHTHLNGSGCPTCGITGFDSVKPGILYYLSINNGEAYKIGITNKTVDKRFSKKDLDNITIIDTWYYEKGLDARKYEKQILDICKNVKYEGPNLLESGNTELFSEDILETIRATLISAI